MNDQPRKPKFAVEVHLGGGALGQHPNPATYLARHDDAQQAADFALQSYHHHVDHINVYPVGEPVRFAPAARRVDDDQEENA